MKNNLVHRGLMILTNEAIGYKVSQSGIGEKYVMARRSNTTGKVTGVTGYPGDVLWMITHHLDGSEAVYSSDEFEPDEVASELPESGPSLF